MKHIVFLTGAGMSVESGFKTFRGNDGLWENYPVDQVASHEGWLKDPTLVTNFYNMLRHKLVPELGYQFNKEWEAGVTVGWEGVEDGAHTFELAPYARYNFCTSKLVDLFLEGTVGYKHYSHDVDGYEFGIKPGVKVNLSDHIAFVTKVGFLGYQHRDDNGNKVKRIGLKLDGTDIQFGLNYKF